MPDRYKGQPKDLIDYIKQLERRITALENGPQAAFTAISRGGLLIHNGGSINIQDGGGINVEGTGSVDVLGGGNVIVHNTGQFKALDALGNTRVAIGHQSDGSYDLAAIDATGANTVNFAQLAFGQVSANVSTSESTTGTNTDLATPGPAVTTNIGVSGRCFVTLSASIGWTNTGLNGGTMLFQADGPTPVVLFSGRALLFNCASAGGITFEASRRLLLTGLQPGSYTFTTKYSKSADDGTNSPVNFGSRNITVEPF